MADLKEVQVGLQTGDWPLYTATSPVLQCPNYTRHLVFLSPPPPVFSYPASVRFAVRVHTTQNYTTMPIEPASLQNIHCTSYSASNGKNKLCCLLDYYCQMCVPKKPENFTFLLHSGKMKLRFLWDNRNNTLGD
jgi:hypothetical protein